MPLKPQTAASRKVATLERHKALLDLLIKFIKTHRSIASEASLKSLYGKMSLQFPEYALIVPYWNQGEPVLRLVKSGEDWINSIGDKLYEMERTVAEDVSAMSNRELGRLLDQMYSEANPDD